jgi:hypothetical protein
MLRDPYNMMGDHQVHVTRVTNHGNGVVDRWPGAGMHWHEGRMSPLVD